jgi:hypothetical protein
MNIVDRTLMRFSAVPKVHPPIAYERLIPLRQEKIHNFHLALWRGLLVQLVEEIVDLEVYARHGFALK